MWKDGQQVSHGAQGLFMKKALIATGVLIVIATLAKADGVAAGSPDLAGESVLGDVAIPEGTCPIESSIGRGSWAGRESGSSAQ